MVKGVLKWLAHVVLAYPHRVVVATVLPCLVMAFAGVGVPVDLSMTGLMNKNHPLVQRYQDLGKDLNLVGSMPLLLEGPEEVLDEAGRAVKEALEVLDAVDGVDMPPPREWFEERAPYLVDRALFDDWLEAATTYSQEAAGRLRDREASLSKEWTATNPEGARLLVVQMADDPLELPMGEGNYSVVEARALEVLDGLGVEAGFSGLAAIGAQDQGKTLGRIKLLTPLSLVLVLLVLRRAEPRALYLAAIAGPMVLSMGATVGAVGRLLGKITILESMFGVMVFGLGVDFALHLSARMREERGGGATLQEALERTLVGTGLGVVAGGFTTIGAYFVVATADDPQAIHMGLSGAIGLLICLVLMLTLLPALWVLMHQEEGRTDGAAPSLRMGIAAWAESRPRRVVGLFLAGTVLALVGSHRFTFETDLEKVVNRDLPGAIAGRRIQDLYDADFAPWVARTDTVEEARRLTRAFEAEPLFERVDSVASILREDAQERAGLLHEQRDSLRRTRTTLAAMLPFAPAARAADLNAALKAVWRLEQATQKGPPGLGDLPASLQNLWVGEDEFYVYAYTKGSAMDAAGIVEERGVAESIFPAISGFGLLLEAMVMGPLEWAQQVFWGILFFVSLLLLVDLRRPMWIFLAMAPVLFGTAVTFGALCWMGRSFNSVLFMSVPLIIGLGVDDGIHVVHRMREHPGRRPSRAASSVGRAIVLTTLTTCSSYSVLLFTDHVGMESMALVLLIGLPMCLLASVALLPALAVLFGVGEEDAA